MIRLATPSDLPRIFAIRDSVHEAPLSDPSAVSAAEATRLIEDGALWVWQQADGLVTGFSAGDARDGSIWALLVAPGHAGKGIGRALLQAACDALRETGHRTARLRVAAGTRAERHYRAAGWTATATNDEGELVFTKPL
ncbi:MAG TPA: GNAT family N-acetyltransferase [Stellaceae bacterium]|nr:GNAT family N-acetyltransferase [Stellaceae bacterium]